MSDKCIFCKVADHELPSRVIYENDDFMVLLDQFPSSLGHTLVIPKLHFENIFDIPEDTAANLQRLVVKAARALSKSLGTSSINILQNNGSLAGQTVFHYHVHLIPRYDGDSVKFGWSAAKPAAEEFDACAEKVTASFNASN
ncbi:MAG: HIT family protein [Defluviitaleaceae bacterium]|nr:HIT family protein [Defluviitaleaceae bacterium]